MIHYIATRGEDGDVLFSAHNGEENRIHGVRVTRDGHPMYAFKRAYKSLVKIHPDVHEYIVGDDASIHVKFGLETNFSSGGARLDSNQVRQYQSLLKPFDALHKKVMEVTEKVLHYPGRLGAFCFKRTGMGRSNCPMMHKDMSTSSSLCACLRLSISPPAWPAKLSRPCSHATWCLINLLERLTSYSAGNTSPQLSDTCALLEAQKQESSTKAYWMSWKLYNNR